MYKMEENFPDEEFIFLHTDSLSQVKNGPFLWKLISIIFEIISITFEICKLTMKWYYINILGLFTNTSENIHLYPHPHPASAL